MVACIIHENYCHIEQFQVIMLLIFDHMQNRYLIYNPVSIQIVSKTLGRDGVYVTQCMICMPVTNYSPKLYLIAVDFEVSMYFKYFMLVITAIHCGHPWLLCDRGHSADIADPH